MPTNRWHQTRLISWSQTRNIRFTTQPGGWRRANHAVDYLERQGAQKHITGIGRQAVDTGINTTSAIPSATGEKKWNKGEMRRKGGMGRAKCGKRCICASTADDMDQELTQALVDRAWCERSESGLEQKGYVPRR